MALAAFLTQTMGIPCSPGSAWVHDGVDTDLFRALPYDTLLLTGQVSTVGFKLQYMNAGGSDNPPVGATNEWTDLTWAQLIPYHGARVHVNIMSADGDDYYHVHPEYTGFDPADGDTELGVDVTFLQTGKHLVTASWVVEASSLHLCTIENIKHAHGVANNALLYPLLTGTWLVDVQPCTSCAAGAAKLLPSAVLHTSALTTLACGKPAELTSTGEHIYTGSYELHESTTCCCSHDAAAHVQTHTLACGERCAAGAACLRVTADAVSLAPVPGTPSTMVGPATEGGETLYPARTCLAVTLGVSDLETGEAATLAPYLGAAARRVAHEPARAARRPQLRSLPSSLSRSAAHACLVAPRPPLLGPLQPSPPAAARAQAAHSLVLAATP